jgi:hypothetical protein
MPVTPEHGGAAINRQVITTDPVCGMTVAENN